MVERSCSVTTATLTVFQWNEYDGWQKSEAQLEDLCAESASGPPRIISSDTRVFIIVANEARGSAQHRQVLSDSFCMPDLWWSDHLDNANGYFGCEATRDGGSITGFNTWSFFEVKYLHRNGVDYYWSKINVFTRWLPSTKQTCILLFDPTDDLSVPLLNPYPSQLNDPFGVYSGILEEVSRLQEYAVWAIRDHVRGIEKEGTPSSTKPQPNYRRLHDIARHAIHVTESLDVAVQNVDHIIKQHELYASLWAEGSTPDIRQHASFQDTSSRLSFFQSHIESIRHRSISNQKRLQNEIQLAFNIVSQHDTRLTVDISAAARSDSATMKTLAFVTLTFLPPTFICAIFSMSFFNFDRNLGWAVSDKLWIYWVFAIPTTIATTVVWQYWHKIFPSHSNATLDKNDRRDTSYV